MMFRQLKVGERLQPFTGTTGQGQAAMLVIAVVDYFLPVRVSSSLLFHFSTAECRQVTRVWNDGSIGTCRPGMFPPQSHRTVYRSVVSSTSSSIRGVPPQNGHGLNVSCSTVACLLLRESQILVVSIRVCLSACFVPDSRSSPVRPPHP